MENAFSALLRMALFIIGIAVHSVSIIRKTCPNTLFTTKTPPPKNPATGFPLSRIKLQMCKPFFEYLLIFSFRHFADGTNLIHKRYHI